MKKIFQFITAIAIVAPLDISATLEPSSEESMLGKEQENSKTILAIFRAIEERNDAQFQSFLQPDFETTGHGRCRTEERFAAWNRSLTAGAQRGRLCSPRKQREKWMPESWLPTTMRLWFCGVNEGAPRMIFWTKRYSDCTTSAKANWRGPRCSTSILRQWPN